MRTGADAARRAVAPGARYGGPVERLGRVLLVRDVEGTLYAVAPTALLVAVATEDGGALAVLTGGCAVQFAEDIHTIASWFSGSLPR